MSALLKLLMTGSVVAGAVRTKLRAIRRSAGPIAVLAVAALIVATVAVGVLAAAAYLALRPAMQDYQAALVVAGAFILIAAIIALIAVAKVRRVLGARGESAGLASALQPNAPPAAAGEPKGEDPLLRLIGSSIQSPIVMTALALGILAGRATKRSRRD